MEVEAKRGRARRAAVLWLVIGLTVVAGTAAAEHGWVPVDCGERAAKVAALRREAGVPADAWEAYERRVREAEEGQPGGVPASLSDSRR